MQDIFTSLLRPESEPSHMGPLISHGNVSGSGFDGLNIKIGAASFYGGYVGAVLVLFFPAHCPDPAQSNGRAYPCEPTDCEAVPAQKGRGVKPLAPQQGGGATHHSQLHQGVLAPFLLGLAQSRFRSCSTASDRSTIESGHYPLLIKSRVGKNGAGVS